MASLNFNLLRSAARRYSYFDGMGLRVKTLIKQATIQKVYVPSFGKGGCPPLVIIHGTALHVGQEALIGHVWDIKEDVNDFGEPITKNEMVFIGYFPQSGKFARLKGSPESFKLASPKKVDPAIFLGCLKIALDNTISKRVAKELKPLSKELVKQGIKPVIDEFVPAQYNLSGVRNEIDLLDFRKPPSAYSFQSL